MGLDRRIGAFGLWKHYVAHILPWCYTSGQPLESMVCGALRLI
jgi:hypothetical protein